MGSHSYGISFISTYSLLHLECRSISFSINLIGLFSRKRGKRETTGDSDWPLVYGVAAISRLLRSPGLF